MRSYTLVVLSTSASSCRPYLVNLLPCLDILSKRTEEQVRLLESLNV